MKKKKIDIKKEYRSSLKFIKESKDFIYATVIVFFSLSLIGFIFPVPDSVHEQIVNFIQELLQKTEGMGQFELIKFIFLNNVQSSFLGIILGIFLGIFPVIALVSNGYLLGVVSSFSVRAEGFSSLLRLLPHGIFELPAIFISFALGIKLGTIIFRKDKEKLFSDYLKNSLKVFLLIIVPLLIIAAIIEGTLIFLFQ